MDKNKYSLKKVIYIINFIVMLITFGIIVFNKHYSSDDFYCFYNQAGEANAVMFSSYRIMLGVLYSVLDFFNINVVQYQIIFGVIMLLCFAIAISALTNVISERMGIYELNDKFLQIAVIDIGVLMLFVNVFIVEWAWFALGYLQWGISSLCATLAAIILTGKQNRKRNYLLTFILLFMAAGCYQISISFFVFLVMMFTFIDESGRITFNAIKQTVFAAVITAASVVGNIIITKIMVMMGYGYAGSRMSLSLSSVFQKIILLVKKQVILWISGEGFLPKYFMVIVLVVYIALLCFGRIKKYASWNPIFLVVVIIAGGLAMCVPTIMQETFWQPARMLVPILSIFTILHIITYITFKKYAKWIKILSIIGIMYLGVNYIEIQINSLDCIKTIAIQQSEISAIVDYIEDYEIEHDTMVDSITIVPDAIPTVKYNNQIENNRYGGEMATRSLLISWSDKEILNFYSGRKFSKAEKINEKIRNELATKNYNYFSVENQVVIDGNTAYIVVY